jgi:hypothetical protein
MARGCEIWQFVVAFLRNVSLTSLMGMRRTSKGDLLWRLEVKHLLSRRYV